ncbi:MAG: hypothetical protein NT113_06540, partial [Hyphomicrobiales bacterium]|nr:hypothetical protein [Hyphomicrobiales bacterium]
ASAEAGAAEHAEQPRQSGQLHGECELTERWLTRKLRHSHNDLAAQTKPACHMSAGGFFVVSRAHRVWFVTAAEMFQQRPLNTCERDAQGPRRRTIGTL